MQQLAPLSGKQQRMGSIYLQPGGPCVTICGCSLLVCPSRSHLGQFWCCSSAAARFGADFLFQHSWLFPPPKQGVGVLAALSASIALQPCSQLCFPVQLIVFYHHRNTSSRIFLCLGSAPGHCFHTCWPLCPRAAAAQGISQLNWSVLHVRDRRQDLHAVFSVWHGLKIFLSSSLAAF